MVRAIRPDKEGEEDERLIATAEKRRRVRAERGKEVKLKGSQAKCTAGGEGPMNNGCLSK